MNDTLQVKVFVQGIFPHELCCNKRMHVCSVKGLLIQMGPIWKAKSPKFNQCILKLNSFKLRHMISTCITCLYSISQKLSSQLGIEEPYSAKVTWNQHWWDDLNGSLNYHLWDAFNGILHQRTHGSLGLRTYVIQRFT